MFVPAPALSVSAANSPAPSRATHLSRSEGISHDLKRLELVESGPVRRTRRMTTFNLNSDEWDGTSGREGWWSRGAMVGRRIGGELIGATLYEVEPGCKVWPYHTHYLNEEWAIVLRGEPTLRTPEGEQVLRQGDIVCFRRGKDGAHQIINRTGSPIRILMLSSMIQGDIIEYLDTGKVLAKDAQDEDVMFARPGPTADYWEGED
jgi:uncharacterized cupin superfamily protein